MTIDDSSIRIAAAIVLNDPGECSPCLLDCALRKDVTHGRVRQPRARRRAAMRRSTHGLW
jgi:hypothetical protein